MKKAAIVLGSESSGTRFLTRLLVQCGFEETEDIPSIDSELLVVRRSYPWDTVWPDLLFAQHLAETGWQLCMLVTVREFGAMTRSKVKAGHCEDISTSQWEIRNAYKLIFGERCKPIWASWILVPYEALVIHTRGTMATLVKQVGGELPCKLETAVDQNAKWYGE